jgi:hypothetical protein
MRVVCICGSFSVDLVASAVKNLITEFVLVRSRNPAAGLTVYLITPARPQPGTRR